MKRLAIALACWALCGGPGLALTCNIKPRVCRLDPGSTYDPVAFLKPGVDYASPTLDCKSPSLTQYKDAVQKLLDQTNIDDGFDRFRTEICALTAIIVFPSYNESFGKYEDPGQNQSGSGTLPLTGDQSTYILLQANIPQNVANIYTKSVGGELIGKNGKLSNFIKGISHKVNGTRPKDENLVALTLVLAHEIGHIRFHRDRNNQKFLNCFQTSIENANASWQPGSTPDPNTNEGRWRNYGDEPSVGKHVKNGVPKPKGVASADDLDNIYKNGFASTLAAASTEEDYVESYTLAVLKAFSTDSLSLDLGLASAVAVKDRPADNVLNAKLGCVNGW